MSHGKVYTVNGSNASLFGWVTWVMGDPYHHSAAPVIPRLHDEAGSTSWLYERTTSALRAHDERSSCARRAGLMSWLSGHLNGVIFQTFTKLLVERSQSQLVEPASSCKRGISHGKVYTEANVTICRWCTATGCRFTQHVGCPCRSRRSGGHHA